MKGFIHRVSTVLLLLALVGCAGAQTVEESATATPTERPTPTPTERPTQRPTLRPTPTPTPAPLSFDEQLAAAENISYEDLFRNSPDHIGKDIAFRGQVIQVLGGPGEFELRIAVTPSDFGFWDDVVYVFYAGEERFLTDDIVDFVGLYTDVISYESAGAGEITIPSMYVNANGLRLVE